MIRRWPCIVSAIPSCFLAFAISASAAESWVAWSETYTANDATGKIVWGPQAKPERGFESLEKCETYAELFRQRLATFPSSTAPGHTYHTRYFCLPTGTDPREPKEIEGSTPVTTPWVLYVVFISTTTAPATKYLTLHAFQTQQDCETGKTKLGSDAEFQARMAKLYMPRLRCLPPGSVR